MKKSRRCTATTKADQPCKAWAVVESTPPRCAAHGGGQPVGAPPGNQNAKKHGYYSPIEPPQNIDDLITGVADKIALLDQYIGAHKDLETDELNTLVGLYGQTASRLGRLLRDQLAEGDDADELKRAIDWVLDELTQDKPPGEGSTTL